MTISFRRSVSTVTSIGVALLLVGATHCGSSSTNNAPGAEGGVPDGMSPESGPPVVPHAITIRGSVLSDGAPVPNAIVSWTAQPPAEVDPFAPKGGGSTDASNGTIMAMTDASGTFVMTGVVAAGAMTTLRTTAPTMAPQLTLVPIKDKVGVYTVPIRLFKVQEQAVTQTTSPTVFGVMLSGRPATVTVPAGTPVGTKVRVAPIDPNDSPPGMMKAEGSPPTDALASVGMVYVEVVDANGNRLPTPPTVHVQLAQVAPPAIPAADPFNAWQLNDMGNWANPTPIPTPGPTTASGFDVTQFGYWNADRNFKTACVKGKLQASAGACGGARVKATGPDGLSSFDSSGEDGAFCVTGAQTFASTLSIASATRNVQMPSAAGNCSVPASCMDIGTVTVPDDQCESAKAPGQGGRPGDPCAGGSDCQPGSICFNRFCVGSGNLRVSLSWTVDSDFDLHLKTPSGAEIYYGNRSADGGTLDVDQCVSSCSGGNHVENIVFTTTAPVGTYHAFVVNFNGKAAGSFNIEVAGKAMGTFMGSLPMTSGAPSTQFSFTVN